MTGEAVAFQGLAPYLPASRPRGTPRWWAAHGALEGSRLAVRLLESDVPPSVSHPCGLAAPCSLPPAFLDSLGLGSCLDVTGTPERLFRHARSFAAAATRGSRQPLRVPHESLSALDRRRLPLFLAALPLLRDDAARPLLFEVDVPAILAALDLPSTALTGARPPAVDRRARILLALEEGALGVPMVAAQRDYAIASFPALAAILACAMAARLARKDERRPADTETWVPLP
jgi:hypothetical protein